MSVSPDRGYIVATRNPSGKPCALFVRVKLWSNGRRTTEVIGAATCIFTFNQPADFIHISHQPVTTGLQLNLDKNNQKYAVLPPFFTKMPSIANIFKENLSNAVQNESNKGQEPHTINPVAHFDDITIPSARLDSPLLACPGNTRLPHISPCEDAALIAALEELFNRRPVWLRSSMDEHLPITFSSWKKRIAFSRTCYLFSDGPWRGCVCKLGYDPRSDPASRIYQIIDYRDPYYRTISWKTDKQTNSKVENDTVRAELGIDNAYLKVIANIPNFNPEVHFLTPPSRPSQLYQLCDIFDAGIQKIINERVDSFQNGQTDTCSKTTGWYSQATLSKIRDMMNVKSLRMRQNMYTNNLMQ
ncbi:hypothetical protein X943_000200 [Babesia divergens]|uniref:Transcription factor IIIC subunit 5 HTH domain-containing protein n=1 Tax=Babesia divergens TaxID=32595 RepID=A0AAD9LFG5_BABDI|nr:hypothetical protein X943_000200 [Babesia divergens]